MLLGAQRPGTALGGAERSLQGPAACTAGWLRLLRNQDLGVSLRRNNRNMANFARSGFLSLTTNVTVIQVCKLLTG